MGLGGGCRQPGTGRLSSVEVASLLRAEEDAGSGLHSQTHAADQLPVRCRLLNASGFSRVMLRNTLLKYERLSKPQAIAASVTL